MPDGSTLLHSIVVESFSASAFREFATRGPRGLVGDLPGDRATPNELVQAYIQVVVNRGWLNDELVRILDACPELDIELAAVAEAFGLAAVSPWPEVVAGTHPRPRRVSYPSRARDAEFISVRHQLTPYFVGRQRELRELRRLFASRAPETRGSHRIVAVSGLGGIGKTTLARHYVEAYGRAYDAILWVDLRAGAGIVSRYAQLFDELVSDPQQADASNPYKARELLKRMQNLPEDGTRWLLVVDDAQDEAGLKRSDGGSWLPTTGAVHVLLTTRHKEWAQARVYTVGTLSSEAASELLVRRAKNDPDRMIGITWGLLDAREQQAVQMLVEKLGRLPLALEQAGAFARETGTSLTEYRMLFDSERPRLLADKATLSMDYPESVFTTWAVTRQRLEREHRRAADLLRQLAFLGEAPVGIDLLVAGSREDSDEELSTVVVRREWVGPLWAWSMAEQVDDGASIALHRLVREVERAKAEEAGLAEACQRWAERIVRNAAPESHEFDTWRWWRENRPHLAAVDAATAEPETLKVLAREAAALRKHGKFEQAEALYRRVLRARIALLGADHPRTVAIRANLGSVLWSRGEFTEAEHVYREVLAFENLFGTDSSWILGIRANLALVLNAREQHQEAETLLRDVLAKRGTADIDGVVSTKRMLATVLISRGEYQEAEILLREVMSHQVKGMGPDQVKTLSTRTSLARVLHARGQFDVAIGMLRKVIAVRAQPDVLGPDHPKTLRTRHFLAQALLDDGQTEAAETELRDILTAHLRIADSARIHPDALATLHDLLRVWKARLERRWLLEKVTDAWTALSCLRSLLSVQRELLGRDHVDTLTTQRELAWLLFSFDEPRARSLLRRTLELQERSDALGPHHRETLTTRGLVAASWFLAGKAAEARDLAETVLGAQLAWLGADDPDTLATQFFVSILSHLAQASAQSRPLDSEPAASTGSSHTPSATTPPPERVDAPPPVPHRSEPPPSPSAPWPEPTHPPSPSQSPFSSRPPAPGLPERESWTTTTKPLWRSRERPQRVFRSADGVQNSEDGRRRPSRLEPRFPSLTETGPVTLTESISRFIVELRRLGSARTAMRRRRGIVWIVLSMLILLLWMRFFPSNVTGLVTAALEAILP